MFSTASRCKECRFTKDLKGQSGTAGHLKKKKRLAEQKGQIVAHYVNELLN